MIVANLTAYLAASAGERMVDARRHRTQHRQGQGRNVQGVSPSSLPADPDYELLVADFADWWVVSQTLVARRRVAKVQAAGLRAGQAFARAYVRAKRAAGVADFDDLIAWTRRLFATSPEWANGSATSSISAPTISWSTRRRTPMPTNGRSSTRWPSEFFSGNPEAEDRWRTLFMVGDYKQAIFGFQGTDPQGI